MRKHSYEYIKEQFDKENYILLSEEYKNSCSKLEIRCPNNHIFKMSYGGFRSGYRCVECSWEKNAKSKRLTYEFVKKQIEKIEYKLLSGDYKNAHTKLKIKCNKGHIFKRTYDGFKNVATCPACSGFIRKYTYEQVKRIVEKEGYKLLSKIYKNNSTKVKMQCDRGHIYKVEFSNFQQGHRCKECNIISNEQIIKKLNRVRDEVKENENKDIEVKCKYCGKFHIPKRQQIMNRINYINGNRSNEALFYCSDNCKQECPIFWRKKYPKGFKPATSREVQPQLRKLVFERDDYTCQKCNTHQDNLETGLHCHHIDAVINNPIESADIDNSITLCKECHKEAHNIPGCGYHELRCTKKEKELNII